MTDPPQTGTWEIQVAAEGTPRVRVQGKEGGVPEHSGGEPWCPWSSQSLRLPSLPAQTSLDFLFHFGIPVEDGPHPGLYPLTQPVAGRYLPPRSTAGVIVCK